MTMTARPILFSGPMVRALLDGRKTQTRRVVKDQDRLRMGKKFLGEPGPEYLNEWGGWQPWVPNAKTMRCPYGARGDLLWSRETWQEFLADELPGDRRGGQRGRMGIPAQPDRHSVIAYRADGELPDHPEHGQAIWRPSIHMPRWASRLTLRITDVRVERLQDINGMDAKREGVEIPAHMPQDGADLDYARRAFSALWDSINGAGAWESNPWVWAVSFEVIEANVDAVIAGAAG